MLNEWRLALRCLWRDCRAGQWFIVFFALLLAVTTLTGIHFFTGRLASGLNQHSAEVLGGDLVIQSSTAIPASWLKKSQDLHLRTAETINFPTVVTANHQLQLVNIQAVSSQYPLYGKKPELDPHTFFTESRLLPLLSIKTGDPIKIGAATFTMKGVISPDIKMMNTGAVIAPIVLIKQEDVAATQILLPGSHVNYQLLVVGHKIQIQAFRNWLTPQLNAGQRIMDVENQRLLLLGSLQRSDKYIQLIVLFCLLMCGTVITLSVRQHLNRHYEDVALWRCLGAPEKQITAIFLKQLALIALTAGFLGCITGYFLQAYMINLFQTLIEFPMPMIGFTPVLLGFATSIVLLFGYAFPIIFTLPRTSPLYIWRNETRNINKHKKLYAVITLCLLLFYVYWMMDFSLLALFILDSLLLGIGFLYVLNAITLSAIKKLVNISSGSLRRGLSQFIQYPETVSIQLTAFILVLMSLFILSNIKHNLLGNWQASLPKDTPNYFAFNIDPGEMTGISQFFAKNHINLESTYPLVKGRLITLNGKSFELPQSELTRVHHALHNDLNISAMPAYPLDNKIIAGRTFNQQDHGKLLLSVEASLASELHLKLGDQLGFQIGNRELTATIANIRSVDWGSFHPNFYIILPPESLDPYPATYITSFHLQPEQASLLTELVSMFPNIAIIDIATTLQQLQCLLNKAALALQYLLSFTICAAVLIFITNLLASLDERRQTYKLLRTLGASRSYLIRSLIVEFSFLGVVTVFFAFVFATVISRMLISLIF